MRLNNFEKHLAEKINEYPSTLDTNALWATLESDLDKKKKRRFIFLTSFLLLVIGGITLYQFQTKQNQLLSTISATEAINAPIHETTSAVENTSKGENTSSINDSETGGISQQYKTRKTVQTTKKDNNSIADYTAHSIANTAAINSQPISIITSSKTTLENSNTQVLRQKNIEKTTLLDLLKIDFLKKENNLGVLKTLPEINPIKNWSLYISSTFGIFYTDRKIAQKNEDASILKDLRNSSEKSLESLNLGVGIELKNKNNFFLTSGLNFNQITEQFDNQSSEFTTENIQIVTEINYLRSGVREEIMGTYEQPQEIISTIKVYNTLRWMEFNVGGGYYFTKKRLNLGVGGGLLWGAMLNAEGKILKAENNIIEIENQNPSIYKNNLGLGAFANLEARYSLKPRLRLSAQFGYKYMPSSFTKEDYPLDIKYQWWGTTVGLQYRIF